VNGSGRHACQRTYSDDVEFCPRYACYDGFLINFDRNASTPILPEMLDAMMPCFTTEQDTAGPNGVRPRARVAPALRSPPDPSP